MYTQCRINSIIHMIAAVSIAIFPILIARHFFSGNLPANYARVSCDLLAWRQLSSNIVVMPEFFIFNFLPIIVVEAFVLKEAKWASLGKSFFDSALMNFASFLGLMLNFAPEIQGTGPLGLVLFWIYSTLVEGVILTLLERHPARRTWATIAAANAASCLLLALLLFIGLAGSDT